MNAAEVFFDSNVLINLFSTDIAERYRLTVYDGMIIGAALLAGCGVSYSEDLQHRQEIEGSLVIHNPFRDEGEAKV